MRIALFVLLVLVLASAAAMAWQHLRYLNSRRGAAQDHQPLLHSRDAFHAVTFLRVGDDEDVIAAVRALRQELAAFEGIHWVYAGKVVVNALTSTQLGPREWSALVVLQHPSRDDFDRVAASDTWRKALGRFPETYTHGFRRSPGLNLMIPQMLLGLRIGQLVTGRPEGYPFEPMPDLERTAENMDRIDRLEQAGDLGKDAIVIMNLLQHGTPEQQASDRAYGLRMAAMMARLAYGPLHMATAVTVEGDARFDRVALVYYPGVDYFVSMARSRYFQGIIGGKQLGDTQATMTVPILDRL